jgi:putative serine protease PepD
MNDSATTSQAKPSNKRKRWLMWVGFAVAIVAAGVIGAVIRPSSSSSGTVLGSSGSVCNATDVSNKDLPMVVTISEKTLTVGGTGSGEIIRSNGYILTNNHVIAAVANSPAGGSIDVLFSDGTTQPATIVGRDPQADLAVIKVSGDSDLPVIPFGSSSKVVVGQPVVALGAPLGLSDTVTTGIVSALDRTITVPSDNGSVAVLLAAVQTDASINPGNSGGALVDCHGKLIGVNSAGATVPSATGESSSAGSIGINFAIPVDIAKAISDDIINTGKVTHASFGIQVVGISPSAAQKHSVSQGLYVAGVTPGGPSAQAGLQVGDIITKIDGQPATSAEQLAVLTITKSPGDSVKLQYVRDGNTSTATVVLGVQH